jgi:hypothetical protein
MMMMVDGCLLDHFDFDEFSLRQLAIKRAKVSARCM